MLSRKISNPILKRRISWAFGVGKSFTSDRLNLFALSFFTLNLFINYAELIPNLSDIYFWDEALYINYGRLLTVGITPPLSDNPFTAAFYALTYLPFMKSPYWMVQSCSLGRIILFCCLWLGAWLVARQLAEQFNPLFLAGMVFVAPAITNILSNPSDAVFAAVSSFGLWQLLKYIRTQQRRHLLMAAVFVSLSALSRNDGLLLFPIFFLLSLFASKPLKKKIVPLMLTLLIFAGIVGGYVVIRGAITGDYQTGIPQRSYIAFRQGQDIVFRDNPAAAPQGYLESLFGTEEENNGSYLVAIMRHPAAYLPRLWEIIKTIPALFIEAYNKKLSVIILLLAMRGIIEQLRNKQFLLLALLLGWQAYLLIYFLTFFRTGYFLTSFIPLFALSAYGLSALIKNLSAHLEKVLWTTILLVLCLYGLVDDKLAIYAAAGTLLIGIWLIIFFQTLYRRQDQSPLIVPIFFLCLGLIIRGSFPTPKVQALGQHADEQAVKYMSEHLPKGSYVAAGAPGAVWAAKMNFQQLSRADAPGVESGEQLYEWLVNHQIKAVYLDYHLASNAPYFYDPIQDQNGKGLRRVFMEDEGSIQIFLVNPSPEGDN